MSTRSIVSIVRGNDRRHFYRHHDGMPYRAGADLATFLHRAGGNECSAFSAWVSDAVYDADLNHRRVYEHVDVFEPFDVTASDCDWHYEFTFPAPGEVASSDPFLAVRVRVYRSGLKGPVYVGHGVGFLEWIHREVCRLHAEYGVELCPIFDHYGRFARHFCDFEPEANAADEGATCPD